MKRILVIDDDDMYRAMLRKLFADAGYEVEVAENGVVAMQKQAERPADLVVTDIIMPEKEGIQTIIEMSKLHPQTRIIAMSGGGRINADQYLQMARALGASRSFVKPFKTADILACVRELLNG